jgi:DNA-directed RNA polymerase subunit RPC12/RpoP
MNLLNFVTSYPDEASCRKKFKEMWDKEGIVCSKCGSRDHYWKKDKGMPRMQALLYTTEFAGQHSYAWRAVAIPLLVYSFLAVNQRQPVEGKTTKKGKPRKGGHLKMLVIDDLSAQTITPLVESNISKRIHY